MATSASRELQRRAMYEESHLDRLRRRYPDLDERGLQLKDLLDRAPRAALVVLRRLCEKDRARPPPELARLFALDKFILWRVLSFWRSDRDLPPHITTRKTTAPYYYW